MGFLMLFKKKKEDNFCVNCVHYQEVVLDFSVNRRCLHPDNMITDDVTGVEYIATPINQFRRSICKGRKFKERAK